MVKSKTTLKRFNVLTAKREGLTQAQIKRKFGYTKSFINRWFWRNETTPKKGQGRKTVLTRGMKCTISRSNNRRFKSLRKVAELVHKKTGKKISHQTVKNYRKKTGTKPFKVPSKPPLTPKNIKDRKRFASKHVNHRFFNDYFSDEKKFYKGKQPNTRNDFVWSKSPKHVPSRTRVKHPYNVNLFGIVGLRGGVGVKSDLYLFEENLNSVKLIKIYKKILFPFVAKTYTFGDGTTFGKYFCDGDPKHRSKATLSFLEKKGLKYYNPKKWPGNSPDFNPTEKAWRHMTQYIEGKTCKTNRSFKMQLRKAWASIEPSHIEKWFKELIERIDAVNSVDGDWVGGWNY